MCRIEFHTPAAVFDRIPHPFPASRHVPDWFKRMPTDYENGGMLKRCPPFLEAMTAGYLIPLPVDLQLEMDNSGEVKAYCEHQVVSGHFAAQYKGAPFEDRRVIKFHNPWIIVTPPEYVCLITAPVNRFEIPLMALTGIVETGQYYKEVQLPVVCMLAPGQRFVAARGTPIIQVIPMRREAWTSEMKLLDEPRRAKQQELVEREQHAYKDHIWKKLQFD